MAAAIQLEQFDVFALLREEMQSTEGEINLDEIADRVLGRIAKRDLAAAVAQLLPGAASGEARRLRHQGLRRPTLTLVADAGTPTKSSRWERAADAVARRAEQIRGSLVTVGPHLRKPLADCTAADVEALITMHQRLADENLARADSYQRLLDAMREKNVRKAGKLKDAALVAAVDGDPS